MTAVLDFVSAPTHPELREGALRLIIDALSRSPALQLPLGEADALSRLVALVGPGLLTSSGKYALSATSELLQPTGLSTAAVQDVLVALSLLCNDNPANQVCTLTCVPLVLAPHPGPGAWSNSTLYLPLPILNLHGRHGGLPSPIRSYSSLLAHPSR